MANEKQKMPPMRAGFSFMWFWAMVIMVIIGFSMFDTTEQRPIEGDWNMVDNLVENGCVERIEVRDIGTEHLRAEIGTAVNEN